MLEICFCVFISIFLIYLATVLILYLKSTDLTSIEEVSMELAILFLISIMMRYLINLVPGENHLNALLISFSAFVIIWCITKSRIIKEQN